MIASKGYMKLVEACRILKERNLINFECDFAGDFVSTGFANDMVNIDEAAQDFFNYVKKFQLDKNINYHGVVTGDKKHRLLLESHIFVLPTMYPGEGQPISIIEALSYATPVISTKYRGIPEQVKNEVNGILIETQKPESIADAIESIVYDKNNYRKLSINALNVFNSKFTKEQYLDRLIPMVLYGK